MTVREPERLSFSRVTPVALLVVGIAIGLLGTVPRLGWNGPLAPRAVAVGAALEAVLVALLAATFRRRPPRATATNPTAATANPTAATTITTIDPDTPDQLRLWLRYLLAGLIIAVAALLIAKAHLHLPSGTRPIHPPAPAPPIAHHHKAPKAVSLPAWVLYVLLAICVIAAVIAAITLSLRLRRPRLYLPPRGGEAVDPDDLRDALAEGAAALRDANYDDARRAIIACYLAMERRLGDKSDADTPDELLAKATRAGLVHGTAAKTLTGLFYEARFSTHPLSDDKRDTARQALDQLMVQA
jgi:hypothetical protein